MKSENKKESRRLLKAVIGFVCGVTMLAVLMSAIIYIGAERGIIDPSSPISFRKSYASDYNLDVGESKRVELDEERWAIIKKSESGGRFSLN